MQKPRNDEYTTSEVITQQMLEPRPLPMGRQEFEDWSDRLIAGALVPHGPQVSDEQFRREQQFVLANMILHLGPTESHKPDAHFIHCLRKQCASEVAHTVALEIQAVRKKELEEAEKVKKLRLVDELALPDDDEEEECSDEAS